MTTLKAEFDSTLAMLEARIESMRTNSISTIGETMRQLRVDNESMKNSVNLSIQSLGSKIDQMESSLSDLRSQLLARAPLSAVSDLQSDLDSVKNKYARKTDLDAVNCNCAKVSEFNSLKQNCATKADLDKLRDDCTAKSEFDSLKQNCAMKTDLDKLKGNYVLKSEFESLKQNSIPKAEWTRRCGEIVGESTAQLIPFESGAPLNGIIRYLTKSTGGNLSDRGLVDVTSSSVNRDRVPKHAIDLDAENDFCSKNLPGQWICLEFKRHRVQTSHYSMRSFNYPTGYAHPKSWVIEGSHDNQSWMELDRRFNNDQLNGQLLTATFHVAKSEFYRYIRLRQTDANHYGSHWLIISAFELFGRVSNV
jgi:hypothetical protein